MNVKAKLVKDVLECSHQNDTLSSVARIVRLNDIPTVPVNPSITRCHYCGGTKDVYRANLAGHSICNECFNIKNEAIAKKWAKYPRWD